MQQASTVKCATAAGGGFRSGPGRVVFQTKELCQSIIKPNLATNKVRALQLCSPILPRCKPPMAFIERRRSQQCSMQVAFAILGVISGSVGLRGTFAPQGDNQDTVKVCCSLKCSCTLLPFPLCAHALDVLCWVT